MTAPTCSICPLSMTVGSRPSCRRRQTVCGLPLSIFLFLSHCVWSTLQCSSSSSHSSKQPSINIINVPRKEHSHGVPNGLDRSDENHLSFEAFSSLDTGEFPESYGQSSDPSYFRRNRDSGTGGQESLPLCGNRLRYALKDLCNMRFHDPSNDTYPVKPKGQPNRTRTWRKRSIILRRLPRTVVNECCQRSCNVTGLLKYCKNESKGFRSQDIHSSKTDVKSSNDEILDEGQGSHHPGQLQHEQEELGNNTSAVISPLPRNLIPLGSLSNDYRSPYPAVEYQTD